MTLDTGRLTLGKSVKVQGMIEGRRYRKLQISDLRHFTPESETSVAEHLTAQPELLETE